MHRQIPARLPGMPGIVALFIRRSAKHKRTSDAMCAKPVGSRPVDYCPLISSAPAWIETLPGSPAT